MPLLPGWLQGVSLRLRPPAPAPAPAPRRSSSCAASAGTACAAESCAGWTTYFLGPDTPVEEIADAARRLAVDAVVMSSSTHFHRVAVRHAVDALKRELPGVDIWVGGPAFVGAATGWLPQEVADLDELLGDAGDDEA